MGKTRWAEPKKKRTKRPCFCRTLSSCVFVLVEYKHDASMYASQWVHKAYTQSIGEKTTQQEGPGLLETNSFVTDKRRSFSPISPLYY